MERQPSIEDIIMVETVCNNCGAQGHAPTLKYFIEDKETWISKEYKARGHVRIYCKECSEK